jgi:mannose-6-phosphate isomerase-like protein (cupin superfamily)
MGGVPEPGETPLDALPLHERLWYVEGTTARRIELSVGEFWEQVIRGVPTDPVVAHVVEADGWLIGQYDLDGTTDHEEMHPNGDELHLLVSGELDIVLVDEAGREDVITVPAGSMACVPRGAWHRLRARTPSRGIAATAGRGTQHRPISAPPDPEPRPAE